MGHEDALRDEVLFGWEPRSRAPSANLYGYVHNSPTGGLDSTGMWPLTRDEWDELRFQLGCVAAVALCYEKCLNAAKGTLGKCLAGAQKMCPKLAKEQIDLCLKVYYLDAAECTTFYTAGSLCCMVPYCNPFYLAP